MNFALHESRKYLRNNNIKLKRVSASQYESEEEELWVHVATIRACILSEIPGSQKPHQIVKMLCQHVDDFDCDLPNHND